MKLLGEPKDKVEKAENLEKAKKIYLSFPEAADVNLSKCDKISE